MEPILLIDTSYISFYRFHATVFWYKKAHKDKEISSDYEWMQDQVFMDKFKSMYLKGIDKILKKQKLDIPYTNFIFGLDCSRKDIWRRKLFPDYKKQRDYTGWKGRDVLKYAHTIFIDELSKKYGFNTIKINNLEADDVLAISKKYIREVLPNKKIIIITIDHDYFQLIDNNTTIINLQNKVLNNKSCGNPKKDLQIKILCGDPSDNIKGCFKRCGKKTAEKYCNNNTLLEKAFEKNEGSRDIYKLNQQLIDFDYIPNNLKQNTINLIKSFSLFYI